MLNLSSSLPDRLRPFLEQREIDLTICDYLVGVAHEVVSGSMDFEEFVDVVLLVTRDTDVASIAKEDVVLALCPDNGPEVQAEHDEPSKPEVFYEPEKLSSLMQRTNISESSGVSGRCQETPHQPRLNCDINALRDVTGCVDNSNAFLEHIVQQHHGSLEAAVEFILDHPNLSQAEALWDLKQQGEDDRKQGAESVQKDQQALKQSIVASYAFTAEKPTRNAQAVPWGEKKGVAAHDVAGKVRYREGIKVTTKGEKHVYEQTQTDWDGGSRGKVYSKGKRGKGFQ